ncbi:MAG: M56 family metallopeptidase [Vicinamibacterales bacterium]
MEVLLNWFWQASVLVAGVDLLLSTSRRLRAAGACWIWWMGLSAVLLLPLAASLSIGRALMSTGASLSPALPRPPDSTAVLAAALWVCWIVVALVRLWRSHRWLVQVRAGAVPLPDDLQSRLPTWQRVRHTGRPAGLVLSNAIDTAVVVGTRTPLIAVSPALLSRVSTGELDQVIAHEWAHVQRRDDVARWIQAVIYVFAGFHPAVRWAFRRLDCARELACDAQVVRLTGRAKAYALCLTNLAGTASHSTPVLASAVLASSLAVRVSALIAPPVVPNRYRRTASACLVAAVALLTTSVTRATLVLAPVVSREIGAAVATLLPAHSYDGAWSTLKSPLAAGVSPARVGQPVAMRPRRPGPPDAGATLERVAQAVESPGGDTPHDISRPLVIQSSSLPVTAAVTWPAPVPSVSPDHVGQAHDRSATFGVSAASRAGAATARRSQQAAVTAAGAFTRAARTLAGLF